MPSDDLTMTFTRDDWRIIAIACMRIERHAFIDGKPKIARLKEIAHVIAKETGKGSEESCATVP